MVGELFALGSAFTWALVSVLLRNLQSRTNALSLNAFRSLFAAVLAMVVVAATGRLEGMAAFSPQALVYLAASVLVGMGVGDTLYFYSLKLVGVARGLLLSNSYPILAAILAAAFLGEPLTLGFLLGTLLVVFGVILVLIPSRALLKQPEPILGRKEKLGIALALLAALFWAAATSLVKVGAQDVDGLSATTLRLAVGAMALMAVGGLSRSGLQIREYRGTHLLVTVAAGVVTVICSATFLLAVQLTGAAKTATLTSTAPLFGTPMSLLMGERLTWQTILGGIISVAGVWLVVAT